VNCRGRREWQPKPERSLVNAARLRLLDPPLATAQAQLHPFVHRLAQAWTGTSQPGDALLARCRQSSRMPPAAPMGGSRARDPGRQCGPGASSGTAADKAILKMPSDHSARICRQDRHQGQLKKYRMLRCLPRKAPLAIACDSGSEYHGGGNFFRPPKKTIKIPFFVWIMATISLAVAAGQAHRSRTKDLARPSAKQRDFSR